MSIFLGVILAVIGSILINIESIYKNINKPKRVENSRFNTLRFSGESQKMWLNY